MAVRLVEKIAEARTPREALDIVYNWLMRQERYEAAGLVWNEMLLEAKANGFKWWLETDEGYDNEGYDEGYERGLGDGFDDGYEEGYADGLVEGDEDELAA